LRLDAASLVSERATFLLTLAVVVVVVVASENLLRVQHSLVQSPM
jgi:hypothetical protein